MCLSGYYDNFDLSECVLDSVDVGQIAIFNSAADFYSHLVT